MPTDPAGARSDSRAPELWLKTDPEAISTIDEWIDTIHPAECEDLASRLPMDGSRYWTTSIRLVAHCLDAHKVGVDYVVGLYAHLNIYAEQEVGLCDAVRRAEPRLTAEVKSRLQGLEAAKGGPQAARLVAYSVSDPHFGDLWRAVWAPDVAESVPRVAGLLFRVAAFGHSRVSLAGSLLADGPARLFGVVPEDLVHALIHADGLASSRSAYLEKLLDEGGVRAASVIISASSHLDQPPPSVRRATRYS